MAVFHYVADVLKDVPLFDCESSAVATAPDETTGANTEHGSVYNDFDHSPLDLLHRDQSIFCFSQTTNMGREGVQGTEEEMTKPIDVTYVAKGTRDIRISCESTFFDNSSLECDEAYREKVYKLLTNWDDSWEDLEISVLAEESFRRRLHLQCNNPDSVYDAWLLKNGFERDWFDYQTFNIEYPDAESHVLQREETTGEREEAEPLEMNSHKANDDESFEAIKSYQPLQESVDNCTHAEGVGLLQDETRREKKKKRKTKKKKRKGDSKDINEEAQANKVETEMKLKKKRRRVSSSEGEQQSFEKANIVSSTPVKKK